MRSTLQGTQRKILEGDAQKRKQDRDYNQRQPKSANERDRVAEVGAEHINRAMAKIDDIPQTINQGEPACENDQQRGKCQGIGDQQSDHAGASSSYVAKVLSRSAASLRACSGKSVLAFRSGVRATMRPRPRRRQVVS